MKTILSIVVTEADVKDLSDLYRADSPADLLGGPPEEFIVANQTSLMGELSEEEQAVMATAAASTIFIRSDMFFSRPDFIEL